MRAIAIVDSRDKHIFIFHRRISYFNYAPNFLNGRTVQFQMIQQADTAKVYLPEQLWGLM